MTNKVTKRDVFNAVIAMAKGEAVSVPVDEIVAKMEHEIALLDKKSTKAAGPNPEFAELEGKIMDYLNGVDTGKATADIAGAVGISTQKASPRLGALVGAGKVTVSVIKGKNYYEVA